MNGKRLNGIDFLKFIAAIMITNSHYITLYKDHNIAFATLGVHGNALFFFVSGFFTVNIFNKDGSMVKFLTWFKRKLFRLWPTLIVYPILASLVFGKTMDWNDFLLAGHYWFVRCFIVSFAIIYFILRYFEKYTKMFLLASILLTILLVSLSNKTIGSIYNDGIFHYVCYFSTMLMGVLVGLKGKNIKNHYCPTKF